MSELQFQKLIEILGNIGNVAYRVALQQVYVDAWLSILDIILGIFVLVVSIACGRKIWNSNTGPDRDAAFALILPGMVGVVLIVGNVQGVISRFASPDWNAIEYLARLIK